MAACSLPSSGVAGCAGQRAAAFVGRVTPHLSAAALRSARTCWRCSLVMGPQGRVTAASFRQVCCVSVRPSQKARALANGRVTLHVRGGGLDLGAQGRALGVVERADRPGDLRGLQAGALLVAELVPPAAGGGAGGGRVGGGPGDGVRGGAGVGAPSGRGRARRRRRPGRGSRGRSWRRRHPWRSGRCRGRRRRGWCAGGSWSCSLRSWRPPARAGRSGWCRPARAGRGGDETTLRPRPRGRCEETSRSAGDRTDCGSATSGGRIRGAWRCQIRNQCGIGSPRHPAVDPQEVSRFPPDRGTAALAAWPP